MFIPSAFVILNDNVNSTAKVSKILASFIFISPCGLCFIIYLYRRKSEKKVAKKLKKSYTSLFGYIGEIEKMTVIK